MGSLDGTRKTPCSRAEGLGVCIGPFGGCLGVGRAQMKMQKIVAEIPKPFCNCPSNVTQVQRLKQRSSSGPNELPLDLGLRMQKSVGAQSGKVEASEVMNPGHVFHLSLCTRIPPKQLCFCRDSPFVQTPPHS